MCYRRSSRTQSGNLPPINQLTGAHSASTPPHSEPETSCELSEGGFGDLDLLFAKGDSGRSVSSESESLDKSLRSRDDTLIDPRVCTPSQVRACEGSVSQLKDEIEPYLADVVQGGLMGYEMRR